MNHLRIILPYLLFLFYIQCAVSSIECQQCHEACLTCTGQSEKDCMSCNDGFYVNSETNFCESCGPNCKKCDKPSECITCYDGYSTYNSQQCEKCDDSCKTCQGMTKEDRLE